MDARLAFLFPAELRQGSLDLDGDGVDLIELGLLDPLDEDERSMLVLADHPEFHVAIREGVEEVRVDHNVINPHLHLAMHEIVANQVINDELPQVWQTAQRLVRLGYERDEVLHMIAGANAAEIWQVMTNQEPADPAQLIARLDQLPETWEQQRDPARHDPHQPRRRRT